VCSAVFFVTVEHDCNHSPIRNFVILWILLSQGSPRCQVFLVPLLVNEVANLSLEEKLPCSFPAVQISSTKNVNISVHNTTRQIFWLILLCMHKWWLSSSFFAHARSIYACMKESPHASAWSEIIARMNDCVWNECA
jgi:hypothetical protein